MEMNQVYCSKAMERWEAEQNIGVKAFKAEDYVWK